MSDIDDQWWRRGPETDDDSTPYDDDLADSDELPKCPFCGEELADEDVVQCPYCERYLSNDFITGAGRHWWIVATAIVCLFVILFYLWR